MGVQPLMVSMKEQLPCCISWWNSYPWFLSWNSFSLYAGVCERCGSKSKSEWERQRERERECEFGERESWVDLARVNVKRLAFSPCSFADEEEGYTFPADGPAVSGRSRCLHWTVVLPPRQVRSAKIPWVFCPRSKDSKSLLSVCPWSLACFWTFSTLVFWFQLLPKAWRLWNKDISKLTVSSVSWLYTH